LSTFHLTTIDSDLDAGKKDCHNQGRWSESTSPSLTLRRARNKELCSVNIEFKQLSWNQACSWTCKSHDHPQNAFPPKVL